MAARPYRQEAAALADSLGLPKAETAGDRIWGDVGEAVAGTGLTMGIGGGINMLANMGRQSAAPVANRLANFLTAQPGLQTASAITGSAAASATKEAGGSQRNQLLAGLAGGFGPGTLSGLASLATAGRVSATGTVPTAAAGVARRVTRGNDASGVQSMIDDFAASGTSPSVGQATGNRSASALETYLGNTPGGSGQIAQRASDQAAAARRATDDLSNRISAGGADLTPTQVGTNVQQGTYGPGGFVDRTQSVSDRLYSELDRHLPAGEMVPVSNARGALQEINAAINGAPELSHLFDQAALKQIERALVSDTTGGASVLSRPGMRENAAAYRQYLERQAQEAAERNARRQSLGMTVMEPVPSRADIEQNLSSTLGNMADGTLPYQALKELRSKVGKQVGATFLTRDAAHAEWKKLYAALSRDMEAAATTPEAKKAFARANNYYRLREQRLDAIGKIVQKEGGPEAAYQAMFTGARNGATPLKRVMDSLPAQVRADVSASFLQRMGRASKANQNAAGDAFSMETFLSNWADISPEAKRQLFSNARFGTDYVQNVNKLARMADSIRSGSKVFANPPGTAKQTALGVTLAGTGLIAGQNVMQGNLKDAAIAVASTLALAGANNLLARMMTNPKAVRWLARNPMRKENRPADGASQRAAKLNVPVEKGQTLEEKSAGLIAEGIASNAFVSLLFAQHSGVAGGNELNELVKSTRAAVGRAAKGETDQADGLLTSQAIALNAVFLEMSRRAALNMGEHMGAMETYMRLALKAQSQCRTTLETLAEIKNPRAVAFVKQANIAGGHQQVNNHPPDAPGPVPDEAGRAETKRRPNELLEEISDAQWLDPRAAPATGAGNPELAAVGEGDRPAQRRRKGQGG